LYLIGTDDTSFTSHGVCKAVCGDHNGILGSLDNQGRISIYHDPAGSRTKRLVEVETQQRFAHVVVAGNGHVAAVTLDDEAVIHEFTSVEQFMSYLGTPTQDVVKIDRDEERSLPYSVPGSGPGQGHTLHITAHKITQLVANTACFCALDDQGCVSTWGDNRYGTLQRAGPSSTPQSVSHLDSDGEASVTKVVAGGWMMGAIREDGLAWIWGTQMPGTERKTGLLEGDGGYVEMIVEIEGAGGVLDVLDMAIGEGFVVVVCEGGMLFGVGENGNGQLGEGRMRDCYGDWVEIMGEDAVDVWAGPKTVYVRVNDKDGSRLTK